MDDFVEDETLVHGVKIFTNELNSLGINWPVPLELES